MLVWPARQLDFPRNPYGLTRRDSGKGMGADSMEKIIVAVASTRRPKVEAVREALGLWGPVWRPGVEFELVTAEVPSGVNHTPASRAEMMAGARNRAEALVRLAAERKQNWRYFAGLEGGLDVIAEGSSRHMFLQNWVCVTDGEGVFSYGQSGGILMPQRLAAQVLEQGIELGVVVDAFAVGRGIRDAQGAWGVLTRNLIARQDAFRTAVIAAFAPFFNAALYRD
jgi:inosine/xanthosine triphosphatase